MAAAKAPSDRGPMSVKCSRLGRLSGDGLTFACRQILFLPGDSLIPTVVLFFLQARCGGSVTNQRWIKALALDRFGEDSVANHSLCPCDKDHPSLAAAAAAPAPASSFLLIPRSYLTSCTDLARLNLSWVPTYLPLPPARTAPATVHRPRRPAAFIIPPARVFHCPQFVPTAGALDTRARAGVGVVGVFFSRFASKDTGFRQLKRDLTN